MHARVHRLVLCVYKRPCSSQDMFSTISRVSSTKSSRVARLPPHISNVVIFQTLHPRAPTGTFNRFAELNKGFVTSILVATLAT